MTHRWARIGALAAAAALGATSLLLSESSFYLSAGSDASVAIYTPPLASKLLAYAVFVGLCWTGLFATSWRVPIRGLLVSLGAGVLALGTHALVFNHKRGVIEEFWLVASADRAAYDISDGVSVDWQVERSATGFRLRDKRSGRSVTLFCGLPPWRVDPAPSLR